MVNNELPESLGAVDGGVAVKPVAAAAVAAGEFHEQTLSSGLEDLLRLQDRATFKKSVMDSVASPIAIVDGKGIIVAVNHAWRQLSIENGPGFGKPTPRTEVGTSYLDICQASVGNSCDEACEARDGIVSVLCGRSDGFHMQYSCHSPTRRRWFILSATPIGTEQNRCVVITHTDITQVMVAKEELALAALAFQSQEGMMITDANRIIISVNEAFTNLTGYSSAEALGKTPALLSSGRHDKAFYQEMWRIIDDKRYWQGEMWNRRKDGKIYAEWLTISAVVASDGSVSHYVGSFSDITRDKQAEAEIHRLAYLLLSHRDPA